ncbi:N-6 DNA methylase [Fontisphaera persica]|uniref:DNA methyltransferase n=1 Tax=Fontisphaera persica TaxID=2974023 RepID=UPI0024C056C1|nr:DNA methyltransferase [Fontisphaera persica]WCJ58290.1 N-6 DNA methylase [Fontisphaera persica]
MAASTTTTIKSKQRVADHGEVLTPQHIVEAMLDLVRPETERIDSRFLEPACGTGNFLIEILERKLQVVEKRYAKVQLEYERYAVLAVSLLYGIDILEDNAEECRARLFAVFDAAYTRLFQDKAKAACRETVRYLLQKNIIHGDALSLQTVGEHPQPIVFAEWSLVNGSLMKRRDFAFHELVAQSSMRELPLFSDLGEEVFIPEPVRDYPPVHFLELAHAYADDL